MFYAASMNMISTIGPSAWVSLKILMSLRVTGSQDQEHYRMTWAALNQMFNLNVYKIIEIIYLYWDYIHQGFIIMDLQPLLWTLDYTSWVVDFKRLNFRGWRFGGFIFLWRSFLVKEEGAKSTIIIISKPFAILIV